MGTMDGRRFKLSLFCLHWAQGPHPSIHPTWRRIEMGQVKAT